MEFVLVIGIAAIALFFGIAGIITGIFEHLDSKKSKPVVTPISEPTPEQMFNKCCYCEHFGNCKKFTIAEIKECKW